MIQSSHIILINNDKILLYLRDNKKSIPYPNYWSLIGGKVENGETPFRALKREIKEEINCKIKKIKLIEKMEINKNKEQKEFCKVYLYKGFINKKISEIILTEGKKLSYFGYDEINGLKINPFFKEFILENWKEILNN